MKFRSSPLTLVVAAAALAFSGCHKKVADLVPPPAPAPPPAPTVRVAANPTVIESGQSSTLTWTTANGASVTIAGLGPVGTTGSRAVSPLRSTDYTVTVTSASGASVEATTRVTVNPAPPPAVATATTTTLTEEQLFAQNVHDIYFDYDKYTLRPADQSVVQQDAAFLKSHPGMKVLIEGHCDDRGSEEYNLALGESRAETFKQDLVNDGVDASRLKIVSDGSEKPFCNEESDACWQENRRDHIRLDR